MSGVDVIADVGHIGRLLLVVGGTNTELAGVRHSTATAGAVATQVAHRCSSVGHAQMATRLMPVSLTVGCDMT